MKTGRNDPCPCGSGIKYKKCCAGKESSGTVPPEPVTSLDQLRELFQSQTFGSIEEVNAFAARLMTQRNEASLADFQDLSADQMHRFLYLPFESPSLATFSSRLDSAPDAPIMTCFHMLAEAIGAEGLKATATGNLPRNFCREAWEAYPGKEESDASARFGALMREDDFQEMHVTRVVAGLAGLVRKYKGRFILSRECRNILSKDGLPGIYPRLLRSFVTEYNWEYLDRYPELHIIQQSFLYTLFLLAKYGEEWRENSFYEDLFMGAFPNLLPESQGVSSHLSPEQHVRGAYAVRCLERFAHFMGLIEIEQIGKRYLHGFKVRKLPLLDQVVRFHL